MPAPAARNERGKVLAKPHLWPVVPHRERKGVQVREMVDKGIFLEPVPIPVHEICNLTERPVARKMIGQLEERLLSLEPDDRVDPRYSPEDLRKLEGGKVTARGDVPPVPRFP